MFENIILENTIAENTCFGNTLLVNISETNAQSQSNVIKNLMKNILQNIILIWGYLFPKSISNIGEELLGEILVDVKNNIYIGKHASLRYDCITDAH